MFRVILQCTILFRKKEKEGQGSTHLQLHVTNITETVKTNKKRQISLYLCKICWSHPLHTARSQRASCHHPEETCSNETS